MDHFLNYCNFVAGREYISLPEEDANEKKKKKKIIKYGYLVLSIDDPTPLDWNVRLVGNADSNKISLYQVNSHPESERLSLESHRMVILADPAANRLMVANQDIETGLLNSLLISGKWFQRVGHSSRLCAYMLDSQVSSEGNRMLLEINNAHEDVKILNTLAVREFCITWKPKTEVEHPIDTVCGYMHDFCSADNISPCMVLQTRGTRYRMRYNPWQRNTVRIQFRGQPQTLDQFRTYLVAKDVVETVRVANTR